MNRQHRWGKIWIRSTLCTVLCIVLAVSTSACTFGGAGDSAEQKDTGAQNGGAENAGGTTGTGEGAQGQAFRPAADAPFIVPGSKEETVYVKADASGKPTEKTVEVILTEISGAQEGTGLLPAEDFSDLREIKNTEGDEEYSDMGDGRYLWENHGEDIRYKGLSDRELPVDVRVSYYLEGEEKTAAEIAGKTGAVRIRFDYDNNTDVPFMVLSSALLSSDVFEDVEVTNGRVIDLGEQKAVVGIAFPGLMDSLKLADYEVTEEIDLPEYVEIEARAQEFELDFTATVVSTGLFKEVEEEDLRDLEDLSDDMDELTDASSELVDASGELADGGEEFGGYLSQYFDGLAQIADGTGALDQGLQALSGNVSKLTSGAESLEKGLSQIEGALGQIDLSSISSEGSEEEAAKVQEALETIEKDSKALGEKLQNAEDTLDKLKALSQYLESYSEQVEGLKTAVDENPAPVLADLDPDFAAKLDEEASSQANEAVITAAEGAVQDAAGRAADEAASLTAEDARGTVQDVIERSSALDGLGLTQDQIDDVKAQLIGEIQDEISENTGGEVEVELDPEDVEISLDELVAQTLGDMQEELDARSAAIADAKEAVPVLEIPDLSALSSEETEEIQKTMTEMKEAFGIAGEYAKGLSGAGESLEQLAAGMQELQTGVSSLSQGSRGLTKGLEQFDKAVRKAAEGSSQLSRAFGQISSAGCELGSAYWLLVEGMDAFAEGVSEFDSEGIQSLAELAGPDYLEVIRCVRAAREAEREFTNFSGISEGQKGSVKFVIETEKVGE